MFIHMRATCECTKLTKIVKKCEKLEYFIIELGEEFLDQVLQFRDIQISIPVTATCETQRTH